MIYMLCRNRVADFEKWKRVFDSHAEAHRAAGLKLVYLWRTLGDANNVFFLFRVKDIEKARLFIRDSDADQARAASGVIDGEIHFVEGSGGY